MSKQLAKSTIKRYVIALLLLVGWGLQAVQGIAMESAAPQGKMACCQTVEAGESMSAEGMAGCGDALSQHCNMDAGSCHSVCLDCPAVVDDMSTVSKAIQRTVVASHFPAAIAAPESIDHPPKRVSSL